MDLPPKSVIAFAGARDNYQLALAMHEAGLLSALVTDVYWSQRAMRLYGVHSGDLPVKISHPALLMFLMMKVRPGWNLHHFSDRVLSIKARDLAWKERASLFVYSYYAFEAFKPSPRRPSRRFIFQLHPHPRTVRGILNEELDLVPSARYSLEHEAELSLSEGAFDELASEPHLANGWVAASRYTAQTLAEYGIDRNRIHIVPYFIDFSRFPARTAGPASRDQFTIMFLGSLVQRKGLSYLLDAVRMLKTKDVRILLRGRGTIDRSRPCGIK